MFGKLGARGFGSLGGLGARGGIFPTPGALVDLDFLRGRYFGGTPATLLANTNSTGGFDSPDSSPITAIAANLPRYKTGGLLKEPAVTNIETFGSDFSNATWTKNQTATGVLPAVTTNFAAAPDGTLTADRIQFDLGATPATAYSFIYGTVTSSGAFSNSIWLKSNDGQNRILFIVAASGIDVPILVTPTWQSFAKPLNSGYSIGFGLFGSKGTDAAADILAWGADIEASAAGRSTSTILTGASSVARSADSLSFAGAAVAAAAAGKSSIRYIDQTSGVLVSTIFNAGAFTWPSNALIQRITIYDAVTTPTATVDATISFDGNSLTSGTNATGSQSYYPVQVISALARLGYSIAYYNSGIGGQTTPQMNVVASNNSDLRIPGSKSPYIDIAWEATNDIILNGVTGAQAFANYVTYAQARKAAMRAGDKLVMLDCLPRATVAGSWTAGMETARLDFNSLCAAAGTTYWDVLVKVSTIPQFATPTSMLNAAYVNQPDGTHLTDLGYQLIAEFVTPYIRALLPTLL